MRMHLREDDFESYVRGRMRAEETSTVRSHLAECSECARMVSETRTTARIVDPFGDPSAKDSRRIDRRTELRNPVSSSGMIRVVNPISPERWKVRVLDSSKSGLKLAVPVSLEPRMMVQVRLEDVIVFAEVRYCIPAGSEFYAGIQILEKLPTSFSPKTIIGDPQ